MTALDQAFIKAYRQQGAEPEAGSADRAAVPLAEALAEPLPSEPAEPSAPTVESVLSALASPAGRRLNVHRGADCASASTAGRPATCPASEQPVLADDDGIGVGLPERSYRVDAAHAALDILAAAERAVAQQSSGEVARFQAAPVQDPAADTDAALSTAPKQAPRAWRPMLQVDHLLWPKLCGNLRTKAGQQLGQLAESLQDLVRQGQKVIGLGGCGAGEGVTTVLLTAARELADRGLKVALVDGNLPSPQLAQRLGLLPQVGWEEALSGRMPLEEVLVESIADRLCVLPVREPYAGSGSADDEKRIASSLDTLEQHFDVVLVDLGCLEHREVVSGALARGLGRRLHSVVLVQNVRATTPNRLAEVELWLSSAGIHEAGVVQNFATGVEADIACTNPTGNSGRSRSRTAPTPGSTTRASRTRRPC